MRRADLQEALELVPEFISPKPGLEQYRTPAAIAAKFMLEAHLEGDLAGKRVLDLGCGTGMLSRAAALLGGHVTGVDSDQAAVAVAKLTVPDATFIIAPVDEALQIPADTVVMNPPFGAQHKHADRPFLEAAWRNVAPGGACWFLQLPQNGKFLAKWCKQHGTKLEEIGRWQYPLEAKHWFHKDAVRKMEVAAFLFRKP